MKKFLTQVNWKSALSVSVLVLWLAGIGVAGYIMLKGLNATKPIKMPAYYYSSDNSEELSVASTNVSGTYSFIVNGQAVKAVNVPPVESFPEHLHRLANSSPLFIPAFIIFWTLEILALVLPSRYTSKGNYYLKHLLLPLVYRKAHGDAINLPKAPAGVIAVRKWGMGRSGYLKSINQGKRWEGLVYEDKEAPLLKSVDGIYAFRLGGNHSMWHTSLSSGVAGIVSMSGKVISHHDHILRAQKVTILCLVAKSEKAAKKLRNYYYCPIFVNTNPLLAIETWAMSEQGLFWQHHNNELIKEKRVEGMADSIESLTAYKEFGGKK